MARRGAVAGLRWRQVGAGLRSPGSPTRTSIALSTRATSCGRTSCARPGTSLRRQDIRWMLALTARASSPATGPIVARRDSTQGSSRAAEGLGTRARGGRHLTRAALAAALTARALPALACGWRSGDACGARPGDLQRTAAGQAVHLRAARRARAQGSDVKRRGTGELTKRYFASHGPATVQDFVWWSGLTVKQAKGGLEMLGRAVESETVNGVTYWSVPPSSVDRQRRWLRRWSTCCPTTTSS